MEKLGEGAFSATYLAVQGKRTVAIKLIEIPNPYTTQTVSKEQLQSAEFQENLRQTSADLNQILRTLVSMGEKKGILRYYDYHITLEPKTGIYQLGILSEYLDNLAITIGKSGMQVRQVLRMAMDLCDGLGAMQSKGIYSGNIKESNIFHDHIKGYKLSDFFFNDVLIQSLRPSETYSDYGYRFLAPEAYDENSENYDYKTDMFTLAILIYKLLNNGLLPFQADSVRLSEKEIRERFLEMKSLPVSPFIEAPLLDILNKAAAFDPNRRYRSYADFKSAIRECMRQLDLLQLDRYLELSSIYPPIYSQPLLLETENSTKTEPPIQQEPVTSIENEPIKKKPTPPPEGVPFTVELRPRTSENVTAPPARQDESVVSSRKNSLLHSQNSPITTEVVDFSDEVDILSVPTGEYVLGPHEKELFSSHRSSSPYAVDVYDDDEIAPAYNYDDEELGENNSFKNYIALVLFFLIMTVIAICVFLFLPYIQNLLSGSKSSDPVSSTILGGFIEKMSKFF